MRRMVPKKTSEAERRQAWREALDAGATLLQPHDGERLPAMGAAHWLAEFADAVLVEYDRRFPSQS